MTGWLAIAGLGPGAAQLVTPEVTQALAEATDLVGYAPYVTRVPPRPGLTCHSSDNRREFDRASLALWLAAEGKRVVILGGGDTGADCLGTSLRQGCKSVKQFELLPRPPEERVDHGPEKRQKRNKKQRCRELDVLDRTGEFGHGLERLALPLIAIPES